MKETNPIAETVATVASLGALLAEINGVLVLLISFLTLLWWGKKWIEALKTGKRPPRE